jgi:hypothetical protein
MNKAEQSKHLAKVKLALAEKCSRQAKSVNSIPRRKKMTTLAAKFRRQAADLTRQ